jgi:hypothetical protein
VSWLCLWFVGWMRVGRGDGLARRRGSRSNPAGAKPSDHPIQTCQPPLVKHFLKKNAEIHRKNATLDGPAGWCLARCLQGGTATLRRANLRASDAWARVSVTVSVPSRLRMGRSALAVTGPRRYCSRHERDCPRLLPPFLRPCRSGLGDDRGAMNSLFRQLFPLKCKRPPNPDAPPSAAAVGQSKSPVVLTKPNDKAASIGATRLPPSD